jgi:ribosomal-protein-alanine N-acetyltransferase
MLSKKIITDRLILRRYENRDMDIMYMLMLDNRLTKYINFPKYTKEEFSKYFNHCIEEVDKDIHEKWIIELNEVPIGYISINDVDVHNNYCNVGYVIDYDHWGHGYATEALKYVTDYLLNERNYYLVECSCNELNIQSSKVMIKAGFKKDGYIANRRLNKDNTYTGVVYYSKTK